MKRSNDVLSNIFFKVAEDNDVPKQMVRDIIFAIFKKIAIEIRNSDKNDIQSFKNIRIIHFGTFRPFEKRINNVQTRQEQQTDN